MYEEERRLYCPAILELKALQNFFSSMGDTDVKRLKPFVKLRPAYSVKLVFSYVVKGIKMKITAKFCVSETH